MVNPSIFVKGFQGKIYYLEETDTFIARIRYDYEKKVFRELLEGHMIFILNFNTNDEINCYTSLSITSLFPKHYALEALKVDGYPGFLKDVMINIEEDWEFEGSAETYIVCKAIPMGYDLITDQKNTEILDIKKVSSKPIPGKEIETLSAKELQKFFSWGYKRNRINPYRKISCR